VFAISSGLKDLLECRGLNRERIVVTGNGIEADLAGKAAKIPGCKIDALYVGRINEKKGVFDLLKVLSRVKYKFPDFQLAVMGSGDPATVRKFLEQIRKEGLIPNVQLLGVMSGQQKYDIIKSSKTFWFLSYNESFGIALLEAVCCGVRSIAYCLKPYAEIYKNNEVICFPVGDWNAVALKVIEVFEKGDFGNKNGELLLREYDWDKIAEIEYNTFLAAGRSR
jgi:glycosyltransferase involved in cell wall biosynthesis